MAEEKIPVAPAACIYHDEDKYMIEVELPGVKKENINARMTESSFCVDAPRQDAEYMGCWILAHNVKPEKGSAKFKNGLLMVEVPMEERSPSKQLKID